MAADSICVIFPVALGCPCIGMGRLRWYLHAAVEKSMKALRILVVEDDSLLGMMLGVVLEDMGHEVCAIAANEADAVAAAIRYSPDLMIVDVRLGEGSGISAVDQIHLKGAVPHLFVTGDLLDLKLLRPGAEVIQKPFRDSDLAQAIERVTGAAATI
jgi:two-component system, response regulator PdtaR